MTTIRISNFVEGAVQATGLAVIIDVFRAFSTACYVFAADVETIIPVSKLETARQLLTEDSQRILIGERKGAELPGFHYGNSPHAIQSVDFRGKTVIHTTTNGTQGLVKATNAADVITGSFVNAEAVVTYIKAKRPETVSLVAMGTNRETPAEEDVACATYIKTRLEGETPDFETIKAELRYSRTGIKFFDPTVTWAPEEDFELCLQLNKFGFVLQAQPYRDGLISLRQIPVDNNDVPISK